MVLKCWFLFVFVYIFSVCKSDDVKSSLTFVIDDTGSMSDDIEEVKLRTNDIFDAVLRSEESQIDNFILVTFNDPDARLRTITRDSHKFKTELAKIFANNGGDCPEYCMTGIELALKNSLPGSYLYVFTDASAKDYLMHDRVKSLAQSKSCQVVFLLTGMCGAITDADYNVYNTLAKATSGQVFHLGKTDVGDIINYVVESVKGRRSVIASAEFGPGYGHNITIPVDSAIDDVMISVAGTKPKVTVKDETGHSPKAEHLVDKDKITIVKLTEPKPGNYTAELGSETKTSAVVSAKTSLNFQHGFSTFKPSSLNDTATRPTPDGKTYLMIKLNVGKKESVDVTLKTAKIVNMDDTVAQELPLKLIDEKQKLYITEPFETPKTMFNIMVTGIDTKTNTTITRTTPTPIEPQNPAIEIKENKAPTVSIEGEPKINVEYDESFMLKCMVNAYPKPDITWKDKSTGEALASTVSDVELPYKYIGTFNIDKVNKNGTYECTATNAYGTIKKTIEIETKRKIYFNPLQVPKDITIEYTTKRGISCKIDAYPPAIISWYKNKEKIHSTDDLVRSDDGTELIFTNMQPNETGLYKCVAENGYNKNVYNFTVTISGVEPPKIDKINSKMNVTRGKDIDILCRIIQGIPEPNIVWYYKKNTAMKLTRLVYTGQSLHIMNVNNYNTGLYTCRADNVMGNDTHEIDLIVEYPPVMKYESDAVRAEAGKEVTLTCEVDGIPPPSVQWFKHGSAIEITPSITIYRDHSLRFKVLLEDQGLYGCIAENHLGVANKSILLNVYIPVTIEPPKISTIDVKVGDDLNLPCKASGYPNPEIRWIHNSNDSSKPQKTIRAKESTLTLSHVQLSMAGYYTCIASNIATSKNISYLVRVLAPPVIENMYRDKTFKVVEGDLVLKIECNAIGSPEPEITWKRDGRNVALGTEWYDQDENGALLIKNIDMASGGSYTCEAVNRFGSDSELYTVEVAPYPKQETPKSTQLVEEGTLAHIQCPIPHGPLDYLRWYKRNKLITKGELRLLKAEFSDADVYTCRVSTFSGSASGHRLVKIGYKPKFITEEEEVYYLDSAEWLLNLICDATAKPSANVSWWHNGKKINVTDMYYRFRSEFNKRGEYLCEISNEFGSIKRSFSVRSTDCVIDIKKDLTGNQPIILDSPLRWPKFEIADGYIRIRKNDEYLGLSCPTTFVNFPKNYTMAFCESGDNFKVNGNTYKFSDLKCTEKIEPEVVETRESCFYGETKLIKVGFKIFNQFLSLYDVCLDRKNNVPIYAKHNLDKYLAEMEPESPEWMSGDLPLNFEEMYDCSEQTLGISDDLKKFFHAEDECCFTRRQLVNPRDVPPGVAQLATYNYLNVVPHWSSCGTENWEEVEKRLRTLVKDIDYSLEVTTGTSKPLELLTKDSVMKEIQISDSALKRQPVSRYLWKVVQDPVTRSSLAIIQINIPDLSPTEVSKHVLCKDICHKIKWMTNPDWHNIDKGYTYCCSLAEYERAFNMKGIFDHRYNRVLYEVSMISMRYLG